MNKIMKKTTLTSIAPEINVLTRTEQTQTKGGILLCCEEKRRNLLGISYTAREWRIVNDGRLFISVRMM